MSNSVFQSVGNESNCIVYPVEAQLHSGQLKMVLELIKQAREDSNSEISNIASHITSVDIECFQNFIFAFDDWADELNVKQQEDLKDELFQFLNESDLIVNIYTWQSIQNEIDSVDRATADSQQMIKNYVSALLESGYDISKSELYSLFESIYSSTEIDAQILFALLKNPNRFTP